MQTSCGRRGSTTDLWIWQFVLLFIQRRCGATAMSKIRYPHILIIYVVGVFIDNVEEGGGLLAALRGWMILTLELTSTGVVAVATLVVWFLPPGSFPVAVMFGVSVELGSVL